MKPRTHFMKPWMYRVIVMLVAGGCEWEPVPSVQERTTAQRPDDAAVVTSSEAAVEAARVSQGEVGEPVLPGRLDPGHFDAVYENGRLAQQAGDFAVAVDAFLLAANLDQRADMPWVQLARMALKRGEVDEAEGLIGQALRLNSGRAAAHNVLGRIWLSRSHWDRAIACFRTALKIQPDNVYFRNNLGFALLLKKDSAESVQVLEPLAGRDDLPAFMYNNLGLAYEQQGRAQDAVILFEKALERNQRYIKARINLQRMVRLAKREPSLEAMPPAESVGRPTGDETTHGTTTSGAE